MPLIHQLKETRWHLWPLVCWYAILSWGRGMRLRYETRRIRRRAQTQAYHNLLGAFGEQLPAGTKPPGFLDGLALKMAQKAPLSLTRRSISNNEGVNQQEDAPELVVMTPSAVKNEVVESDPSWDESTDTAWVDKTTTSNPAGDLFKKTESTLRRLVSAPKRTAGSQRRITVSADNLWVADNMVDAEVLPKPRRSDIKKVDLTLSGYWESNPNALEEIQLATRVPLVHNQIREMIQHLLTSRPAIQGPPDLVEYVRRWFEVEMELSTGHERGVDRFVADLAKQMLHYGSAALIKQRTLSGEVDPITDPVLDRLVAPVWGYAIPDMSTLQVFIDTQGRPRKWRQDPAIFGQNKAKEYSTRDVFLARLPSQNSSLYFWTPSFVMPALYAVNVLRDLHQTIDAHTRGIIDMRYYAKVGSDKYLDGRVTRAMIDKVKSTIDLAPRGSTPVFPWFVSLEHIELQEYVDQLVDAAEFWEREVRRGVGGSKLNDGIGDSSTRNTSDALTEAEMRAAQTLVPEIQRAFRWLVFDKLLEMPGFDVSAIKSWEDLPALVFEEIDMTQQIRRETHYVSIWQNDGLKHGEFRKMIGRDEDPERVDQYFSDITAEKAEVQAAAQFDNTLRLEKEKAKIKSQTAPNGQPRPKRAKR